MESDRGTQADLRLSVGVLQTGRLSAGVFAQATWADAESTRSLYGVTPQETALTGLRTFDPGSGLLFGSVGLLWSLELAPKWAAVGSMEARRLGGDAKDSPLTERKTNGYVSAGVAYRF